MSALLDALQTNDRLTENGMPTHSTSGAALVDLFFKMGALRANPDKILPLFVSAFGEDPLLATKALFYNRDIRGGQGERETFRRVFRELAEQHPEIARKNIANVVKYGRWDDLLVALGTELDQDIANFIAMALAKGDKLCAKWMPREGKSGHSEAKYLQALLDVTPRQYRQILSANTEVVETLMSEKKWGEIDYNKLPSQAVRRYRKAFARNDAERYGKWTAALVSDNPEVREKVKINAGAVYPHEILKPLLHFGYGYRDHNAANIQQAEAQWAALPNYIPEGRKILPVVDVSGSMSGDPMVIAVALGMYISERNTGPFKDAVITFSSMPELVRMSGGTLAHRALEMSQIEWGYNTNLEAVFKLVLHKAVQAKVSPEDMPETILVISDMQFDPARDSFGANAVQMIDTMYRQAGYERPQLVFWNVRDSNGVPVKHDQNGTAAVSGFSPSIMKNILSGKDMTPMAVVLKTLQDERYDSVTV